MPRSWAEDPVRCADAGIPNERRGFAPKPTLARTLIARAVQANVPAGWVAGDEVYGADPHLRAAVRGHGLGYVLAIATNRRVPMLPVPRRQTARTDPGPCLADPLRRRRGARAAAVLLGVVSAAG